MSTSDVTMSTFKVRHGEITFTANPRQRILGAASRAGVDVPHTCGGKGECLTCRFALIDGELSPLSEIERELCDRLDGKRLSCQARARSDIVVEFVGPIRGPETERTERDSRNRVALQLISSGDATEHNPPPPPTNRALKDLAKVGHSIVSTTFGPAITANPRPKPRDRSDRQLLVAFNDALGMAQSEMNRRLRRIAESDQDELASGALKPAPSFASEGYTDEEYLSARRRERLLYFNMEFTNTCNLACTGCFAGFGDVENVFELKEFKPGHVNVRQSSGFLTGEELIDVIDQAADLGAKTVDLIGGGEPLSSTMFFTLAEHAVKRGLDIEVFTNGTLITSDYARRMAELRIVPYIKLYSARSWVHDRMVGVKGAWARAVRGIENLLAAGYGSDDNLTIALETIVVRRNAEDMPTLWRWARENRMIPYFERFVGCHYDGDPGGLLSPTELKELWEELWLIDRGEYGYTWPLLPLRVGYTCATNFYSMYINFEGDVRPCSGVFVELGNIRQMPLEEIMRASTVIKDLREFERPADSWCASCYYYETERCPGCRGMAQVRGGYMADDPLCFHNPRNLVQDADPRITPHLSRIPTSVLKDNRKLYDAREAVLRHSLHHEITTTARLRIYMEAHVFEIWGLGMLLRRLRDDLFANAKVAHPPADSGVLAYVDRISRIVENDAWNDGRSASFVERHLDAMEHAGANTDVFRSFAAQLAKGASLEYSMSMPRIPDHIRAWLEDTTRWISAGRPVEVAGVYLYSIVDLLPETLGTILTPWKDGGVTTSLFVEYAEKCISLFSSAPEALAKEMMDYLAGDNVNEWSAAATAAEIALNVRSSMWDGVCAQLQEV